MGRSGKVRELLQKGCRRLCTGYGATQMLSLGHVRKKDPHPLRNDLYALKFLLHDRVGAEVLESRTRALHAREGMVDDSPRPITTRRDATPHAAVPAV